MHLPTGAGFSLHAAGGGQNVAVDFNGAVKKLSASSAGIRFGEGGPRLAVTAGENISLSDHGFEEIENCEGGNEADWSAMSERIQRRIEEKIKRVENAPKQDGAEPSSASAKRWRWLGGWT